MKKSEILEVLSLIRDLGCCNMLDRNCIIQALILTDEDELANYLKNMTSQDFVSLLSKDFNNYLKN